MARSESDQTCMAPIVVKLGSKEYTIPCLTIIAQRAWRVKLNAEMAEIVASFQPTELDANVFGKGLASALIGFPEKMADLMFAYREYGSAWEELLKEGLSGSELIARFSTLISEPLPEAFGFPRAVILTGATEEQVGTAFSRIMEVAYPLVPLAQAMKAARPVTPPATAKFSN